MRQIREATAADLEVILHHRRSMFKDMGEGTDAELDAMTAAARPIVAAGLAGGTYRGWLTEIDGRVVAGAGVIVLAFQPTPGETTGRRAWIVNVYTEPAFRRRGLARELMTTILDWCRAEGLGFVALHASDDGRPLYEALGFRPTNEMRLVST